MAKEMLVYIVDIQNASTTINQLSSDEDFIKEAERQDNSTDYSEGGVVSLSGFQLGLNNDDINISNCLIRFIEVDR